jgi:hypothetical protein
MSDSSKSVS